MLIRAPRPRLPLHYFARPDLVIPLDLVERRSIESALILCVGNRQVAADALGVSKRTVYLKMRRYKLEDMREAAAAATIAAGAGH